MANAVRRQAIQETCRPIAGPPAALTLCIALGILGALVLGACRAQEHEHGPSAAAASASALAGSGHATPRGQAESGHLTLTGDYRVDRGALTTCALFPNQSFQVAFTAPQAPYVFLYIKSFRGAGTYDAEARVRAIYSGETLRVSRGATKAEIRVVPAAENSDLISGSFQGEYKGEGGKGTVAGRFESCRYQGLRH